jgi:hypothetical protein
VSVAVTEVALVSPVRAALLPYTLVAIWVIVATEATPPATTLVASVVSRVPAAGSELTTPFWLNTLVAT